MIKNIIFDFDGTLVDSSYAVDKLLQHFKQKYNKTDMDIEQFRKIKTMPLGQRIKKMGVPLYMLPAISLEAKRIYSFHIGRVKIMEGIPELLSRLDKLGLELRILSSNSVRNISHFLEINDINCFSGIYSASNMLKKDKAIIKLAKKEKLAKESLLYIGDELHDITACKRIQIKVAAVTWGLDSIDLLKSGEPDCICCSPMDIYDFICKNNS
ncbi:MAG: HAD-IA family hydrolase [Actinomycetota bacterium]